jgi:hypothetical protein
LYAADTRCKHIFFAAANCPKYIQLLEGYGEKRAKVTLVRGSVVDDEVGKLCLRAVAFGNVFRAAPVMSKSVGSTVSSATVANESRNGAVSLVVSSTGLNTDTPSQISHKYMASPDFVDVGSNSYPYNLALHLNRLSHQIAGQDIRKLGVMENMQGINDEVAERTQPDDTVVQQGTFNGEDVPCGNGVISDQEDLLIWD